MAKKTYTPEQLKAIYYLSLPKSERWEIDENGNKGKLLKTYEDIAKSIGIHLNTLYMWRSNGTLDDEDVKQAMLKYTVKDMPEILDAIKEQAVKGSGKHAELYLKIHRMLKEEKTVHNINEDRTLDPEKLREKAMRYVNDEHTH